LNAYAEHSIILSNASRSNSQPVACKMPTQLHAVRCGLFGGAVTVRHIDKVKQRRAKLVLGLVHTNFSRLTISVCILATQAHSAWPSFPEQVRCTGDGFVAYRTIRRQTNSRSVKSRTGQFADYSQLADKEFVKITDKLYTLYTHKAYLITKPNRNSSPELIEYYRRTNSIIQGPTGNNL